MAVAILPKTKRPTKRLHTMGDVGSDITRLERPGTSGVGLGVGEVGGWGALAGVVRAPADGLALGERMGTQGHRRRSFCTMLRYCGFFAAPTRM